MQLLQALTILNLVSSRHHVTRRELTQVCGVSERSIYRYITRLSEANIPIYYDDNYGGYRLTRKVSVPTNYLSEFDIILLRLGLKMLQSKLGTRYDTSMGLIASLLDRLSTENTESRLDARFGKLGDYLNSGGLAEYVSYHLTLRAKELGRKVRIDLLQEDGKKQTRTIERPGLLFRNKWYLQDMRHAAEGDVPLSSIIDMRLI